MDVYSRLRKVWSAARHYVERLGRWGIVLYQVRGVTWRDALKLWGSALAAPWTACSRLQLWQDPQLLWDTTVRVRGVGVFSLRRRTDDLWHVVPWRERRLAAFLEQCLRPGDVFVDAGANIGFYTVLAGRRVGPRGKVLAIEMIPGTAMRLRDHVLQNGLRHVEVVERALSAREGEQVYAYVAEGHYGQASLVHTAGKGEQVAVETTTLNRLLEHVGKVRVLKMDLEGAERLALEGALDVLPRIEYIVFEAVDKAEGASLDHWLETQGYVITALDGRNKLATRYAEHEQNCPIAA